MYRAILTEDPSGIQISNGEKVIKEFGFPVTWSFATTQNLLTDKHNAELWLEIQELVRFANLGYEADDLYREVEEA